MKLVSTATAPITEYTLTKQTTTLGSASDVDLLLKSFDIYPYHAVIWQNRGLFAISDWNNQGNVYVNGRQAIRGQPLWPGDKISLGKLELHFLKDDVSINSLIPDTPQKENGQPQLASSSEDASETAGALKQLAALNPETLEKLRKQSPTIRPASGVASFLRQGLVQTYNQQGKGLFGLIFALPAIALSLNQTIRAKLTGTTIEEAFPEGTWQFYTQFGLREDAARHANETDGFHKAIPPKASEINQAAAWVFQCLTTIFEYESLLENEWVERTLLRLIHESISDSVADKFTAEKVGINIAPSSEAFKQAKKTVWDEDLERIEIETEHVKRNLGLSNLEWAWVKKRPYRKPAGHTHETYPQYRRKLFLSFLVEVTERLPTQMGALIWDRYYELSSEALPAYQKQMSILYTLKPERYEDRKEPIPLWKARLGFIAGGRYYTIFVAHHDARGRLLVFKPGKPDDVGEALTLRENAKAELIDQQGRRISVDRKGNVTLTSESGYSVIKVLRPTPASVVKSQIALILHEANVLNKANPETDILLAVTPRSKQPGLLKHLPKLSQSEAKNFNRMPIIINWDLQNRANTLDRIRAEQRGIGNHALTIFRTESSFVFDQSHIFFDAIWGMVISQIITDGAIETYDLMTRLPLKTSGPNPPTPLRLQPGPEFLASARALGKALEVTAASDTPDLDIINKARKGLARFHTQATVNDILIIYRSLHDQLYHPGLDLQRALATLRLEGHGAAINEVEAMWQNRQKEPVSLFLPMDASFIDPKLRLFPATFKNFLPDFAEVYKSAADLWYDYAYSDNPEKKAQFITNRELFLAYMAVMTEYFKMLKRITRQGESISSAAIRYLAHLPPGMQGTLDSIPEHVGALNELLKGEEVYSNVGRVSPASSLVRFMSAKDDGPGKTMVWGVMCDRDGNLKITLRDFRPYVKTFTNLGHTETARLIVQDYLESFANGLNQFAEDLLKIISEPEANNKV